MKRLMGFVLLVVILWGITSEAAAEVYRGSRLYDLRAEVRQVGSADDPEPVFGVTLTWRVDVRRGVGIAYGDSKVTIRKSPSDYHLHQADAVKTVPLLPENWTGGQGGEGVVMTWTDHAVSPGEELWYRVETGSVSSRFESVSVTVASGEPPGEPAGLDERRRAYADDVTWSEKLAASIVAAIPNWLVNVLGLYDPLELVFMADLSGAHGLPSQENLAYFHVFSEGEMQALSIFHDSLTEFVPVSLVVALVLLALGVLYNSANPNAKIGFREYLLGFVLAMLMLKFGVQLLTFVFEINYAIVQQFKYMALPLVRESFLESLILAGGSVTLGDALIAFIAAFSIGVLNFQYIMRKISIALLIGLIPIVAVVSIAPSKREALGIWFRELVANIFLQSAHAAALAFLLLMIHATGSDSPQAFWVKLAALLGLAGMAGLVRRVIGAETIGSGPLGAAGAMFGIAGIAALGRMVGGRSRPSGLPTAGTAAAGAAAGGTALRAAGSAGRFAAKAGLGATGALAGGMVAGAAMGNPMPGMLVGGGLGAKGADALAPGETGGTRSVPEDDPARDASREVFGRDVLSARRGLAGMRDRAVGMHHPERELMAEKARAHVDGSRETLAAAKREQVDAKPAYDTAKAEHTQLKNLYGPKAAHLKKLQEERLPAAEGRFREAERGYVELLNRDEESRGPDYGDNLALAQAEYEQASNELDAVQTEIETGREQYRESLETFQSAEADYSQKQAQVSRAERNLTRESLVREFTRIKERQTASSGGGVNGPQWRA